MSTIPNVLDGGRKAARGVGKTIKWLLIGGALLIVVVVIAAIVGLGNASDKSDKSSAQVGAAGFRSVKLGTPLAAVKARFGKPQDTTVTEAQGFRMTCLHYGVLSQNGYYEFCFQGGKLTNKNAF